MWDLFAMLLKISFIYPYLISTSSLEQIIMNRTLIFRRFKLISHHVSNQFDKLQSFTVGTEIVYKCDKEGFICNTVCYLKLISST
jgi:hypothetical protein